MPINYEQVLPASQMALTPIMAAGAAMAAGVALAAGALSWGTFAAGSSIFTPIVTRINARDAVALSFDDGPCEEFTPRILDVLAEYDAKATFFLIGRFIPGSADLVRRIVRQGHAIGNHTWDHHRDGILGSRHYWREQLVKTDQAIFEVTGMRPRMFRPPMGFKSSAQAHALREGGYNVIGWNLRAFDTLPISSASVSRRIISRVQPGDIITMHDGLEPQRLGASQAATCEALAAILKHLRHNGLKCLRL